MRAPRFHARVHPLNLLAALLLASPAAVLAQNSPPPATGAPPPASADASLPSAPTTPLAYLGIAPQPALADAAPTATSWRDAHGAVAAFPRGHADIVAWEARNATQPGATAAKPTQAPAASGGGHGHHDAKAADAKAHPEHHQGHAPKAHGTKPAMPMHHHGHTGHQPSGSKP
jgi:hypothetical protein